MCVCVCVCVREREREREREEREKEREGGRRKRAVDFLAHEQKQEIVHAGLVLGCVQEEAKAVNTVQTVPVPC